MSTYIYNKDYRQLYFLKDKSRSFLAWICPLFKINVITDNQYVFFEGDEISTIYFLKNGSCSYVLPKHSNMRYVNISVGHCFGVADILYSILKSKIEFNDLFQFKEELKR